MWLEIYIKMSHIGYSNVLYILYLRWIDKELILLISFKWKTYNLYIYVHWYVNAHCSKFLNIIANWIQIIDENKWNTLYIIYTYTISQLYCRLMWNILQISFVKNRYLNT